MIVKTNAKTVEELAIASVELESLTNQLSDYDPLSFTFQSEQPLKSEVFCGAFVDALYNFEHWQHSNWRLLRDDIVTGLQDHSTHNVYPFLGKMHPQLARALINICTRGKRGSICDPFCGSGTVLVEASLLGHETYGNDVDPFAVWLTKTKLALNVEIFRTRVDKLHGNTKMAEMLEESYRRAKPNPIKLLSRADARDFLSYDRTFDAIVTSPPYFDAIDYLSDHNSESEALKLEQVRVGQIGVGQSVAEYELAVADICAGIEFCLKPGGRCAIVIGDFGSVPSAEWYELKLKERRLNLLYRLSRHYSIAKLGISSDTILIFEKVTNG